MKHLKYSEILEGNRRFQETMRGNICRVAVISNIAMNQLSEVAEYALRSFGLPAVVEIGDYDNCVQDSSKFKDRDVVIVFWELVNAVEGLSYRADLMSAEAIDRLIAMMQSRIETVLANLANTPLVIFNKFSTLSVNGHCLRPNALARICETLNRHLERCAKDNVIVFDIDRIISRASLSKCFDWRNYYSARMLYTIDFLKFYALSIRPIVGATRAKSKKVLVLDCDNTLWGGVLGEDGYNGIQMSPATFAGSIFCEVQHLFLALIQQGVILALCSKNDIELVDDVFLRHPDMVIKPEHVVIKKVNWSNKATNLMDLAQELNVGLDSIVYIDDSDYEIGLIQKALPQVMTIRVPEELQDYPNVIRETAPVFFSLNRTDEDASRTRMYREESQRVQRRNDCFNLEEYLSSLGLTAKVFFSELALVPRLAQLSQKTNQFNLTTKRYSDAQMEGFSRDPSHDVIALRVSDSFGDYGVVGLAIVRHMTLDRSEIDTFLLSCRILGRNIENVLLNIIFERLKVHGVEKIQACYAKTQKNGQVADFYAQAGFTLISESEMVKVYEMDVDSYQPKNINYIGVKNG